MTSVVGTLSGATFVALVALLGASARRTPSRRPEPPLRATVPARRHHRRPLLVVGVALLAVTVAVTVGPAPVVAAGVAVALLTARRGQRRAAARRRDIDAAMPDAVELFVLCVHAGRSPTQAIGDVAARAPPVLRPTFDAVLLHLHRGRSLADALDAIDRLGSPVGIDLATAVAAAERDGIALLPVLDRLAAEARTARRRAGEAAARRLPVRMTFPLVVCTLPSFVLLAIAPAVLGALSTLRAGAP